MNRFRTMRGKRSHRRGLYAEAMCRWALRCKGFRIIDSRYKTPVGEIDIVARRGSLIVFVEVKARSSRLSAAEALTLRTMSRMQRAVNYFMARHPELARSDLRMDAMLVTPDRLWPVHLCGNTGDFTAGPEYA